MKRLVTIILVFITFSVHGRQNPLENVFFKLLNKTHIGLSMGFSNVWCSHLIKTQSARMFIIDKIPYLRRDLSSTGLNTPSQFLAQSPSNKYEIYTIEWPYKTHTKITPSKKLDDQLNDIYLKRKGTNYFNDDCRLSSTGWLFPFKFLIYMEFAGRLRVSFEPEFNLLYIKKYSLRTIPNYRSPNQIPNEIGTYISPKKWSYFLCFPFGVGLCFLKTTWINMIATGRFGFKIPSFFQKGPPIAYEKFWDIGLIIEYNELRNIRPFIKFSFSCSINNDKKIDNKFSVISFNYYYFGTDFGVTFRLVPDQKRCPKYRCLIGGIHKHNEKIYRGNSYVKQKTYKKERRFVRNKKTNG